ncbi:MAG: IS3 family transposase [Deltaproteobacteria bacterium]|nr:IS3 family transposase [Deltaproteobacteria bacterium]
MKKERSKLPVRRACELVDVSRSWYYAKPKTRATDDTDIQDEIEKIVLEFAGYGYRRVTPELRRRGYLVNHKRVLRIMREGELLCQLRRRTQRTTDSNHGLAVYPNLLRDLKTTGLDQAWVADITYIRLPTEFVFLAVILDAYSRKVIGWELSRSLETSLTLGALERALRSRNVRPGLIHHSDQGVQYASAAYVARAQQAGLTLSMSRRGRPRDNPKAESFFRTLKVEQVYLTEYIDLDDARRQIRRFIERVYNHKRLHSALGYIPPVEFEETVAVRANAEGNLGGGTSLPTTAVACST